MLRRLIAAIWPRAISRAASRGQAERRRPSARRAAIAERRRTSHRVVSCHRPVLMALRRAGRRALWIASSTGFSASRLPDQDHPGGERAGALAPEGVEGAVDDVARLASPRRALADRLGDAGDTVARWPRPAPPAGRPPSRNGGADWRGSGRSGRDRLQRHRLRPLVDAAARAPPRARRRGSPPASGVRELVIDIYVSNGIVGFPISLE